jgi:hypothetical protein
VGVDDDVMQGHGHGRSVTSVLAATPRAFVPRR